MRDGFNVTFIWMLKLQTASFERMIQYMVCYHKLAPDRCQIWTKIIPLLLFSVLSLEKAAHFVDQSELCEMHTDNSRRRAAPVFFFFCFFYWRPKHAGFHSFLGTFTTVLPTALNNSVLCGCVRWGEACAQLWPLFIIERLVVLPGDPSLPCYLRADKGGRCGEEINVNPSVFN